MKLELSRYDNAVIIEALLIRQEKLNTSIKYNPCLDDEQKEYLQDSLDRVSCLLRRIVHEIT